MGTLISVLMRIELYSSGNRIISPENQNFYNVSITLHGLLMIFFLVMPGLFGGFGNYFLLLPDPCELTFANTLLLSNAAVSLGGAFVSLEISSQFIIFFSLFSFILAWTFISLQIKEFRILGLSINDSV